MNALYVVLIILFICSIGYTVLLGFKLISSKDKLFALGTSYGLGVGLIGMQLFIYSNLSIPWSRELLLIPWTLLTVVLLFKIHKDKNAFAFNFPKLKKIDKILLLGITIAIAYTILEALIRPVVAWDAWANWLLQAKVFFLEGRIIPSSLNYMDSEYPLTINLLGTFVYLILGKIDDTSVLLTSSAFYIFILITFFAILKKRYGVTYAFLFTFIMATTQNFIRHGGRFEAGLADMPQGYFALLSVILLFSYLKNNKKNTLILLNINLLMTIFIKFEGIPLSILIGIFALFHIFSKKLYDHLPLFSFWFLPFLSWHVFRLFHNLDNKYFVGHHFEYSVYKTINSLTGTFSELINTRSWNLLWIIFYFTLLTKQFRQNKEIIILNTIILTQFVIYIFNYMFTAGHAPDSSIERLLMHLAPLAMLSLAIYYVKLFKRFNKFRHKIFTFD